MSKPASTEVALNNFNFSAALKTSVDGVSLINLGETFPSVSTVSMLSRDFSSYEECIMSCRRLMDDVLAKVGSVDTYKLGSEVNPVYSGQPTLSKDWGIGEVARVWIYDKSMEKTGQIHAIGQARVFGSVSRLTDSFN